MEKICYQNTSSQFQNLEYEKIKKCVYQSEIAYSRNDEEIELLKGEGYQYRTFVQKAGYFSRITSDEVGGFITFSPEKREININFHGTDSALNAINDLVATQVSLDEYGISNIPGEVHKGFADITVSAVDDIVALLRSLLEEKNILLEEIADWKISLTGHSLGGAMATLASCFLEEKLGVQFSQPLFVATFGSPRCLSHETAKWYEEQCSGDNSAPRFHAVRVANYGDPVSSVPLGIMGYKHVGKYIQIAPEDWMAYHFEQMKDASPFSWLKTAAKTCLVDRNLRSVRRAFISLLSGGKTMHSMQHYRTLIHQEGRFSDIMKKNERGRQYNIGAFVRNLFSW